METKIDPFLETRISLRKRILVWRKPLRVSSWGLREEWRRDFSTSLQARTQSAGYFLPQSAKCQPGWELLQYQIFGILGFFFFFQGRMWGTENSPPQQWSEGIVQSLGGTLNSLSVDQQQIWRCAICSDVTKWYSVEMMLKPGRIRWKQVRTGSSTWTRWNVLCKSNLTCCSVVTFPSDTMVHRWAPVKISSSFRMDDSNHCDTSEILRM